MGTTAIITTSLRAQDNKKSRLTKDLQVPVTTHQLLAENNVPPVELKCGTTAHLSKPNELQGFTCFLINHTNKRITAFSIAYTVVVEREGIEFSDTSVVIKDALIHPDFLDLNTEKFVPPGGTQTFNSAQTFNSGDALIKRVELEINYVEYDDKTTSGINEKGAELIARVREGAAKYKDWLSQKYLRSGKSVDNTVLLLQDNHPLATEVEFDDTLLMQGAKSYRKHALKAYSQRGASGIKKLLDK
jgi:hypothetical protein